MSIFNSSHSRTLCRIQSCEISASPPGVDLFPILEQLLPVAFIFGDDHGMQVAGEIRFQGGGSSGLSTVSESIPSLSIPRSVDLPVDGHHVDIDVKFADHLAVPDPFRGRTVTTKVAESIPFLALGDNETVLATSKQRPIWVMSEKGVAQHFRTALPLPQISSDQNFSDVFNGEHFLGMLPLLQFLRELGGSSGYRCPPLRAAFMLDDPNLHWPQYGFVNYRELAMRAQKANYHVSFATIPLDTWFVHTATADIFRQNPRRLSLLVHGNNHAKEELAQSYPNATREALLWQAVRRIERLEKRGNLRVGRVMVPPHGACSNEMLAALPRCGFESACISAGSLRAHNRAMSWTKTLGFFPSEIIEGCPVLPRWGLTGSVKNTLLVAAYLGQPMILRGHHQDLRGGVEVFDELAKFINGLGDVVWSNMTDLSRMNYLWRMEGTTCRVKPLGTIIAFKPPSEAAELIIEAPDTSDQYVWQTVSVDGCVHATAPLEHIPLSQLGTEFLIERSALSSVTTRLTSRSPTSAWLILRRLLTEARDRFFTGQASRRIASPQIADGMVGEQGDV